MTTLTSNFKSLEQPTSLESSSSSIEGNEILTGRFYCQETNKTFSWSHLICTNPDCPCENLLLKFTETGKKHNKKPEKFTLVANMNTWTIPVDEYPVACQDKRYGEIFLANLTDQEKQDFIDYFYAKKKLQKRIANYRFTVDEVEQGTLVSYLDIIDEQGGIAHGGTAASFSVKHNNTLYYSEALYCPNPQCNCKEESLFFLKLETNQSKKVVKLVPIGNASYSLVQKKIKKFRVREGTKDELKALVLKWKIKYPKAVDECKTHYKEVKAIAKKTLEEA